ncbi:DUF481 domain-containing protein [Vibrio nigripulchritudo]|uniref:DUF481 domain-containing protein n=1 Tax=Vibrio nigripulchritudo TaxID=28173 RepID=UPI002490FA1C|nr:DUF481 domain-containing protein [Vibrio nigripulchritudo]BDU37290.1 DUF481 domain-containing protein [Vibrio nigripulchritudo]BDU43010.1 DUF481 domain-containing protein [Vibrio nigripulchritudo]
MITKGRLATSLLLLLSGASQAGDLSVKVGGFYSSADTSMGAYSSDLSRSFDLDFESDLRLKEREVLPYLKVEYAFNSKHAMYLDWRSLHRNSSVTSERAFSVPIDGEIYDAKIGATIQSTLNIDLARLGYSYSFFENENWDLDLTAGIHIMQMQIGLGGELSLQGGNQNVVLGKGNYAFTDVTAPLPDIGLEAEYKINENWRAISHAQVFYIEFNSIKGLLVDANLGVQYQFNENWNAEASYSYYEVNVDYGSERTDLNVNFQFFGPMVTLEYQF